MVYSLRFNPNSNQLDSLNFLIFRLISYYLYYNNSYGI